jgi:hypothetical protein
MNNSILSFFLIFSICVGQSCKSNTENKPNEASNQDCLIKTPIANLMEFHLDGVKKLKETGDSKQKRAIQQILEDSLKVVAEDLRSEKYFDLFEECTLFSLIYDSTCGEKQIDGLYLRGQVTFIVSRGGNRDFYLSQDEQYRFKEIYFLRNFDDVRVKGGTSKRTIGIPLSSKLGLWVDEGYTQWKDSDYRPTSKQK